MAKGKYNSEEVKAYMKKNGCSRSTAIRHIYKGTPSTAAAPPVDEPKAPSRLNQKLHGSVKFDAPTVSAEGLANRVSGTNRYNVAGRPTREQIELVYGPKSFAMTWPQREAIGVTAEQFQDALKAKLAAETK